MLLAAGWMAGQLLVCISGDAGWLPDGSRAVVREMSPAFHKAFDIKILMYLSTNSYMRSLAN